jgi:hypothetical protein
MRTLLALASIAMLAGAVSGCGDDTTSGSVDMTLGPDMSATPHDMATLTCAQLLACVQACTTQACQLACVAAGSSAAKTKFGAFGACVLENCGLGDGGGMQNACTSQTDPQPAFQACITSVGQNAALGGPCAAELAACGSS